MSKTITLEHITKIEGHAHLSVKVEGGKVKKCSLGSTEGARFFEGLVVGRPYDDGVEMTMRICGICSVGHFTASLEALERAMGVEVSEQTKTMREVMSIGERIRSHATHLYFLSLPDFLGFESALAMAPGHPKEIADALHLMRTGNDIITAFGGRQMHPMGGVVGGFTHFPSKEKVRELIALLAAAEEPALRTLKLFLALDYQPMAHAAEHVSLRQAHDFPLLEGTIVSDAGWSSEERDYEKWFTEYVDRFSTAKFVARKGKAFMLGALPRVNNNIEFMDKDVRALVKRSKVKFPSKNPFHNIPAQAIELVHWTRRCRRLLTKYKDGFTREEIKVVPRAGTGVGVVEVPRGVLFHSYTIDEKGYITKANIMTPTCQNLKCMEADVRILLQGLLDRGVAKADIPLEIEKLIRAYDPCFSCSTHFLKVEWEE